MYKMKHFPIIFSWSKPPSVLRVMRYLCNVLCNIITFVEYAIKTGNITQVTLLANVTCYLSNIVTVTNLILCNIITTSNEADHTTVKVVFPDS